MTFLSSLTLFLEHIKVEKGLAANTVAAYRSDLELFNEHLDKKGITDASAVDSKLVEEFISMRRADSLSSRSIAREVSALKNMYRFLESEKIVTESFINVLETRRIEKYFPDFLTEEEVDRILDCASEQAGRQGARDLLIIKLLYGLGLRVSELCRLKISDFDMVGACLRVSGKGSKQRMLPVYPGLLQDVKTWLKTARKIFVNASLSDSLLLNKNGGELSRISVWKIIKNLAAAAGIKRRVYPHTFRHTFATHMLKNGADIITVQSLLGHSDIKTTEIYTHLVTDKLAEELRACHPLYD